MEMTLEEAKAKNCVKPWAVAFLNPVKLFADKCEELGLDHSIECHGDGSVVFWIEFEGKQIKVDSIGSFDDDGEE